jgi:cell division protein FtsB
LKTAYLKFKPYIKTTGLTLIVLVILCLFVNQSLTIVRLRYQTSDLNSQISGLQNENKSLQEKISEIGSDKYIEEQARNKMGMVKSGELPVKVIVNDARSDLSQKELKPTEKVGIYMRDWYGGFNLWVNNSKKH